MKLALRDTILSILVAACVAGGGYVVFANRGLQRWARYLGNDDALGTTFAELVAKHGSVAAAVGGAALALPLLLVLAVLWPTWALTRSRLRERHAAVVLSFWLVVGAASSALFLVSLHPLLSLRVVPIGPRAFLNRAFELAGYFEVNLLSYMTACLCAASFGLLRTWSENRR